MVHGTLVTLRRKGYQGRSPWLVGMTAVQAERPPSCENCGCATVKVGKLSRLGLHPLINVYKCQPCRQIISITSAPFISDLCIRPEDVRSREEPDG